MFVSGGRADRLDMTCKGKRRIEVCDLSDWADGGGQLRLGKQIWGRKVALWFGPVNLDVS